MRELVLDITDADAVRLASGRGAVRLLRSRPGRMTLSSANVGPSQHDGRVVPVEEQLRALSALVEQPSRWRGWMVVGSVADEDLCISVAHAVMVAAARQHLADPANNERPFLWPIYGGQFDRLRDREDFRLGSVSGISTLVLTNLADNSTREKIEKARDLLDLYSSRPCVLVVAGMDPLAFAMEHIRSRPTSVLHMRRSTRRRSI